jgi:hypothetical protein
MFLAILLLIAVSQWVSPSTFPVEAMILFMFGLGEAVRHARFVIFFALVCAPVLAILLAKWLPAYRPSEDHPMANAVLITSVICGLIALFPSGTRLQKTLELTFPVRAVGYLRQHEDGYHTFNDETWGGFLMFSLGVRHQVFMDGRDEMYTYNGVIEDYIRIIQGRADSPDLLRKYDIKRCLIRKDALLAKLLAANSKWKQVYGDDLSIIVDRVGQATKPGVEK